MASSIPFPPDAQSIAKDDAVGLWEARLFGTFRLSAPDGTDTTPTSRKARALVAYLLASTDDGASRERLAGLFWSARGEDQARASLRQTFYEIRALTSGEAPPIVIVRTRVVLVADRITSDDARIAAVARTGEADLLCDLIGHRPADFLADLDGIDPAFDEWLSLERMRRSDARRRAVLTVAQHRLAVDDPEAARRLVDRLLACDPADEGAASIAMTASQRCGDRDAIRRCFASLTDALRRQVGVAPSAETAELHRSLMGAPAPTARPSPVGPVVAVRGGPTVVEGTSDDVDDHADAHVVAPGHRIVPALPSHFSRARWAGRAAVVAVTVALATGIGLGAIAWRHPDARVDERVLSVRPVDVAPNDAGAAPLRVGFAAELARLVVGRPRFVVRDDGGPGETAPDGTFVVTGDARSVDGVVHVALRLLAGNRGPILWSTTLERPADEAVALREQMAAKVADVATCALDGRYTDLREFETDTLQLMFGACDARHDEPLVTVQLLEQLTRKLPRFSHGWAMLAMASAGRVDHITGNSAGVPERTEAFAARAIALDPHDGDAYFARAFALTGIARWPERMAILREGLKMDPDNADLAYAFAHDLAQVGYAHEALTWGKRAVEEDPLDALDAAQYAKLLEMEGFGPTIYIVYDKARRRFGNDAELALTEFRFHALVGDYRRAAQILADPGRGFHFHPKRAALWHALIETRAEPSAAADGDADRAFAASFHALPEVGPWTLETLSFLHHVDEAYAYADRMAPRPADEDVTDSLFAGTTRALRADPRFMTLAARLGLVTIWRSTGRWPDFCSDPQLGYDCRVEADRALSSAPRPLIARR